MKEWLKFTFATVVVIALLVGLLVLAVYCRDESGDAMLPLLR